MKLQYCPETDSLSIELKLEPGADTREVADGLIVDIDAKREVDGFDIDQASIGSISAPLRRCLAHAAQGGLWQPERRCKTDETRDAGHELGMVSPKSPGNNTFRRACCRIQAEATLHQNIVAFSGSGILYVDVRRQDFGLCNSL